MLLTGGLDAFVDYGFTNKGAYSDLGSVGYVEGFRMEAVEARELLQAGELPYAVPSGYRAVLYLVVPAALVLLALAWLRVRGVERLRVEVVGLFALAASVAVFPRADGVHVGYVAPVLLVAGWYALDLLLRRVLAAQAAGRPSGDRDRPDPGNGSPRGLACAPGR